MATITELKDLAEENEIDLVGALDNKATIIARLNEKGYDLDENGDDVEAAAAAAEEEEAESGDDVPTTDPSADDTGGDDNGDDGNDPEVDDDASDEEAIDEPDSTPAPEPPREIPLAEAAGFTNRDPDGQLALVLQQRMGRVDGLTELINDMDNDINVEDIRDSDVRPRVTALTREELEHRIRTSSRRVNVVSVSTVNTPIDLPEDHGLSTRELMLYVAALDRSGEISVSAPEWHEFKGTASGDTVEGYTPNS